MLLYVTVTWQISCYNVKRIQFKWDVMVAEILYCSFRLVSQGDRFLYLRTSTPRYMIKKHWWLSESVSVSVCVCVCVCVCVWDNIHSWLAPFLQQLQSWKCPSCWCRQICLLLSCLLLVSSGLVEWQLWWDGPAGPSSRSRWLCRQSAGLLCPSLLRLGITATRHW